MAYLALLWKARTIEKYRLNYEKEKLNSIRINNAQNPKKTLYQKWCHINLNTKKRLSKAFLRYYPKGSKVYNFFYYLRTDQTFPNFVLKSVIGFVGGIIMTYLCFMFFVFQLSISLIYATIMSSIIGVLLTLGLAFSYRVRCLVFLLIPQFFSRVGRYTLTCYVLVLILTGPATNTLKNSEVLSESLACGQEQVKTSMRQINDCVKKPFNSMKDNIRLIVDSVKLLAKKLKHMVVVLNRMVMSLAASLQSSFAWLNSAAECCNRRLGTPYDRCQKAIGESLWGCQAYLGPDYSWLCSVAKVANAVCWPVQPMKGFCYVIEYANNNVLGVVSKNLKKFSDRINSILQVDVQFHHSYSLSSNASRSASQVAAGIVTEIRNRADPLLTWLSWSSCVTSLSLLLIIFRAKHYQHMFETRSRFDNRYVTKELRDLDLKRLRQGKATVLPLNRREDGKYIKTTSFRLVSSEKVHLSRSVVTMIITTFKLMIHMVADYSLYWVLMTIRYHGRFQTPTPPGVPNAGVYVSGSGLISKILRSLVGSISLPLDSHLPSPVTCLPNPSPPDFQRYIQIGILIFLLWFFALFEPYGLRLRHVIMGLYSPERAKARAVWLYNHIQRTRGCFMKFARRKLHRQYKYLTEEQYTIRRWLNSHIPFFWLRRLLGVTPDDPHCFLCGIGEPCNECDYALVSCGTPSCPGTFCRKCFSDIGEMCTICMSPADYGDMSDVSLEKDSSDEDDIDEGEDDDGDDDDDDPFPGDSSLADDNLDHSFATDFDDGFIPRNDVTRKRKWFFFPKENRDSDLEKGTSKQDIHDDHDKETAQELPSLKNISKALIARHRKYSKLDFEDERRKVIMSLGQDTQCLICFESCKRCNLYENVNIYNTNTDLKVLMHKSAANYSKDSDFSTRIQMNKTSSTKQWGDHTKTVKEYSKIEKPIVKLIQRFKNMRRYSLTRRHPNRYSRNKNSKPLLVNVSLSLKKRQGSLRKRRKKEDIDERDLTNPAHSSSLKSNCSKLTNKVVNITKRVLAINSPRNNNHSYKTSRRRLGPNKLSNIIRLWRCLRHRKIQQNRFEINKPKQIQILTRQIINASGDSITLNNNLNKNCKNNKETEAKKGKTKKKDENKPKKEPKQKKNKDKVHSGFGDCKEDCVAENKTNRTVIKLYKVCSDYWKNVKLEPAATVVNYFKREDAPIEFEKTNHKKRKKDQDADKKKKHKDKIEHEATRMYRISSYLYDQDWMKKKLKKSKLNANICIEPSKEIQNDLPVTTTEPAKKQKEEGITKIISDEDIEMVVPKLQELRSPKVRKSLKKKRQMVTSSPVESHRDREHVVTVLSSVNESTKNRHMELHSSQSFDYGMPRSLKYFRSLGHRDFDQDAELELANEMYSEERGTYRVEKKVRAGGDQGAAVDTRIPTASHSRTTRGREHNVGAVVYATEKKEYEEKAIMFPDNEPICQAVSTDPEMITKKKKKDHHRNPFAAIFCCCRGKETRRDKEKKKMRIQEHKQKESKKRKKNKKDKKDKVDAQVCVCPATTNCACQVTEETSYQEQTTQVYQLKEASQSISRELCRDVEVDAVNKTCTCATQFMSCIRNVSTFHKTKSLTKTKSCKDASTMHYKAGRRELRKDNATSCRDCNKHSSKCAGHHSFLQMDALQTSATQCQPTPRKHHAPPPDLYIPTCSKKLKSGIPRLSLCSKSDTGTSMDSIHSISSIRSDDGTKTDTTVCSMATIRYDEMPKKKNKLRVTVVTKSNRSTATDTQKVCDVSTVTSDWWSPILERKDKSIMLARRGGCPELVPQRSPRTRHVGVSTEGRTVKFKSRAQIIPTLKKDILSPSRYLLESQKYYNELFSSKVYAPHVLSINTMQRQEDKKRSVNRRSGRRNHKAKRLVECYSPRKMMAREHVWTAETKNLKTSSGHHKKHRVGVRQKRSQLSEKSHDAPTLDVKVGEVNMLTRQYDAATDLHGNSYNTTDSF